MTEVVKSDIDAIIEDVKQRALDVDTLFTHVHNGTLDTYYTAVLNEIVSDLIALPVERSHLGLDLPDSKEEVDEITQAVFELSLLVASWFMKQPHKVQQDLSRTIQDIPAEDIREARFLLRHNLLN